MDEIQKRIFRSMTAEQKLEVALRLYHSAWELKAVAVRAANPSLSEEEVRKLVGHIFLYARA